MNHYSVYMNQLKPRLLAGGFHLMGSIFIAVWAAILVLLVWYPFPYREVSGGRGLFSLVISVDVILGPLLTFAIFNLRKPISELRRDLVIIVLLQLGALSYGLWTVYVARPVYLAFEFDRFRVVHAIDVVDQYLPQAPAGFNELPKFGPGMVAVRPFKNSAEKVEATFAALRGVELGSRPDLWQPYKDAGERVRTIARPVSYLVTRFTVRKKEIDEAIAKTHLPINELLSVPMVSRQYFWTVLLNAKTLEVVGFVPIDSFP